MTDDAASSGGQQDDRTCEYCGRWVEPNEVLYHARLQVYAEPRLQLDDEELSREARAERWDSLVRRMEAMSDEDVDEAMAEVHEEVVFYLCPSCRGDLHKRLLHRRNLA